MAEKKKLHCPYVKDEMGRILLTGTSAQLRVFAERLPTEAFDTGHTLHRIQEGAGKSIANGPTSISANLPVDGYSPLGTSRTYGPGTGYRCSGAFNQTVTKPHGQTNCLGTANHTLRRYFNFSTVSFLGFGVTPDTII